MEGEPQKWKAALVGALVCGIFGPVLGAFLTLAREAVRQNSLRAAVSVLPVFPYLLPAAVVVMGPAGLIVGSVGGLILQSVSAMVGSFKGLAIWAAALGLVLGGAVPLIASLLLLWSKDSIGAVLPISIAAGMICGAITVFLLHRWRLLRLQSASPRRLS